MTPGLDEDKVFIVHRGNMQTRHDPYYYLPKFVRLEARVTARSTARLRDYVQAMSGGSTPKKEEEEKYYSDEESGIPFVRVQNLNVDGHLSLNDVKYVNLETHQGLLNRSRVLHDDLLVKITGVGRMAVASVPPIGFEGNINQHIARIRTGSRDTSEALAAWLNTDIAETLAKRRSTGGTRPALDYPALRSMPVILDEQVQKELSAAYAKYKQAEAKASELLAGIDEYLLSELGIILPPEPANTIASRIFTAQRSAVEQRIDPAYFSHKFSRIQNALLNMPHVHLRDVAQFSSEQWDQEHGFDYEFPYLEISAIETQTGDVIKVESILLTEAPSRARMLIRDGDILISTTRPNRGAITFIREQINTPLIASTGFSVVREVAESSISKEFLFILLRSKLCLMQFEQRSSGGNYPAITQIELGRVLIPLVALPIQGKVVDRVCAMKEEAKRLRKDAECELDAAKRRIEAMLLGEFTV